VNNLFKPHLRGQAILKYFRVFDRWGVMVYESTQMGSAGWDGTYKGVPQPVGVYVYEVSAVTGTGKQVGKTGNVTLLR
jgi:gliding motility-associated-like protein